MNFINITGTQFDGLVSSLGIRRYKLRFQGSELKPTPAIADNNYQPDSTDFNGELMPSEQVHTYSTTIPGGSLKASNISIEDAVLCDAIWELWNTQEWIPVRVREVPDYNPTGDRYKLMFVEAGIGEEFQS